ncbi:Protein kinase superfamily protein [Rhynchospora pubera]|uniref:Protein kinase superfamily protein n=1 Tax=Rhynchospora pubera TaxID=906938 RepID=A0AAV8FJW7_9POAL|nr:Protein kinase superfamily protein [Rhynchospora pubera]
MRFKFPSKGRAPLLLSAAVAAALTTAAATTTGDSVTLAADGIVRSSRAISTIAFVVADYKYSLHGLARDSEDYPFKQSEVHLRSAKKLLKLCEANGGFYVKAGQFVSSLRQVPKEYTSTLSCLQDKATPYNFEDIKMVIEKNLGRDLSTLFLAFDERPIAAASIAQVHHGVLKNKQEVAIKVQYPGLEQRMKIDIMTMAVLSKSISKIFPDFRFERVLHQFQRTMSLELDFIQEANNSQRVATYFRKNKAVKIPLVFRDLTTPQVLTMEFCHGHKVDDLDYMREMGISPVKVANTLMELFAEMIFVHGFVHGDPHPGNILVSSQGNGRFNLVLLDHGIYRELDEKFRLDYCQLWKALIMLDSRKVLDLGEKFGVGKYAKYFPVIFTGRTIESKSALGVQMTKEERNHLKDELRYLRLEDITSFMDSLPPDFLVILRTDGLLRSIIGKLGVGRHVCLLAYAKHALCGLEKQHNSKGFLKNTTSQIRINITYLHLRLLLGSMALISQLNDTRHTVINKLKDLVCGILHLFHINMFTL